MALVDIQVVEGVFDAREKEAMIRKVTDVMVSIEGEAMRGVTWVRVHEIASRDWGIAGEPLTTEELKAVRARNA
jgi:4-oxalocrotonate tautomerase